MQRQLVGRKARARHDDANDADVITSSSQPYGDHSDHKGLEAAVPSDELTVTQMASSDRSKEALIPDWLVGLCHLSNENPQ